MDRNKIDIPFVVYGDYSGRDYLKKVVSEAGLPQINLVVASGTHRCPDGREASRHIGEVRHGKYSTVSWGVRDYFCPLGEEVLYCTNDGRLIPGEVLFEVYSSGSPEVPGTYVAIVVPAERAEEYVNLFELALKQVLEFQRLEVEALEKIRSVNYRPSVDVALPVVDEAAKKIHPGAKVWAEERRGLLGEYEQIIVEFPVVNPITQKTLRVYPITRRV